MMDSMGRELLFAGSDRRRVIPASPAVEPRGKVPGLLPCGCLRTQVCCAVAKKIIASCQAGFETGMRSGAWDSFDTARALLEEHLQTE